MGSKCSGLSLTTACRTQSGASQHQCCAVFEMCEGEWSWVQLNFAAWVLFLVPAHSGEWRRDPAVMISRDISRDNYLTTYLGILMLLEEQHTKTIDKQRFLSCTGILVFAPQGPSYLFFHDFLAFLFFVYFSLFKGSWRKWNETGVPWVLPFLSLGLCCKRTCHPLVLSWHCIEQWLWKPRCSKNSRKSSLWSATQHHRWCVITEAGTAHFSQGLPLISNLAKQNKIKQKFPWNI